jgi:hypothetical protein
MYSGARWTKGVRVCLGGFISDMLVLSDGLYQFPSGKPTRKLFLQQRVVQENAMRLKMCAIVFDGKSASSHL